MKKEIRSFSQNQSEESMRYNLNLGVLLLFGIALAASTLFSQASKAAKPSFEEPCDNSDESP